MTSSGDSDGRTVGLIGRDAELSLLRGLVSEVASGRGASVLVEGEAGSGKTALLDVLADECRDANFTILRGMGDEVERRVPFYALQTCLRSAGSAASGGPGDLSALLSGERGQRGASWEGCVTDAVVALVDNWTIDGPVALLVDDLHWADPSSLAVFTRLQRVNRRLPLFVCVAVQTTAQQPDLMGALRLLKQHGSHTVHLSPLTGEETRDLVTRLLRARPTPALTEHVSAAAAGNPLLVTEVVAALRQQNDLRVARGVADVEAAAWMSEGGLPRSLKEVVPRRLAPLTDRSRDVLDVAAVLGPRFHLSELSIVLGTPVMTLWELVGEALENGLLISADGCLAFRHDLFRRALIEAMPHAVRSALQQQVGEALAAAGTPPERAAEHLLLGGGTLGTRTVDWLVQAASSLVLRSPGTAAELLAHALRTVRPPDPRAEPLSLHLAEALLATGKPARAEEAVRAALSGGAPATAPQFRWLLAQCAFRQGRIDVAVAEAEALLDSPVEAADAAQFHTFISQCHFIRRDLVSAEKAALRAVAEGEASNDAYVTATALTRLAILRIPAPRTAEALELTDRALAILGNQEIRPGLTMAPHLLRAVVLTGLDRPAEAHRAFDRGLRECGRGQTNLQSWYHIGKARLHYDDGRWDDAMAEVSAGLGAPDSQGIHEALQSQAAVIAVHRGDAETYTDLVLRPDDSVGGAFYAYLRGWALALTREAHNDRAGALALLLGLWRRGSGSIGPGHLRQLCPDIARLAMELDDTATLRLIAVTLSERAAAEDNPYLAADALLCQGATAGNPDLLLGAAEAYRDLGWLVPQGYAWECATLGLAERGHEDTARKALQAALAVYERLGAVWDTDRAVQRAAGSGIRVRRRSRRSPLTGWAALTTTEWTIIDYVVEGRSNPDIGDLMVLSPRTIQSHLSRIYAKLGVSSRVELAVSAHQHAPRLGALVRARAGQAARRRTLTATTSQTRRPCLGPRAPGQSPGMCGGRPRDLSSQGCNRAQLIRSWVNRQRKQSLQFKAHVSPSDTSFPHNYLTESDTPR